MAVKVEYTGEGGFFIIRIDDKKYYCGNGTDTNGIGISANQFLRFHPYMTYVGDKDVKASEPVMKWLHENISEDIQ